MATKSKSAGRWGQFLTNDQRDIRWEKVIMAGSSHGSTTAARFSMHQPVDRVVMFCGPRDNTETWQGGHSATPPHRFFGFSHVLDKGWQEDHYCRSWQLLKMNQCGEVINVEKSLPPFENTRRLITDCRKGMSETLIPVWSQSRVLSKMKKVHFVTKQCGNISFCILSKKLVNRSAGMQIVR